MKTSILTVLAIAILIQAAVAQEEPARTAGEQGHPSSNTASSKPLVVAGRVSRDGRTLVTDIDSEWAVRNPEALKGHEGRRVAVKCYVDTEKSRIQVLRVSDAEGELKYAARHGDSAFRR